MRPVVVVVVDPGTKCHARVLDGFEVSGPRELFFEGLDEEFAQPVLLRRVRRDVFLGEAVVGDDRPILALAKHQAVVVAKLHACRSIAKCSEASQERLLQGALSGLCLAG